MAAKECGGSCPAEPGIAFFRICAESRFQFWEFRGGGGSGNRRPKRGNPRQERGNPRNGSFRKFEVSVFEGGVIVEMSFLMPPWHKSAEDASCFTGVWLYLVVCFMALQAQPGTVRIRLRGQDRSMSAETLATGAGSSSTLQAGCDLVSQPLPEIIQLKQEPEDEEELDIRRQMQVSVGLGNP